MYEIEEGNLLNFYTAHTYPHGVRLSVASYSVIYCHIVQCMVLFFLRGLAWEVLEEVVTHCIISIRGKGRQKGTRGACVARSVPGKRYAKVEREVTQRVRTKVQGCESDGATQTTRRAKDARSRCCNVAQGQAELTQRVRLKA